MNESEIKEGITDESNEKMKALSHDRRVHHLAAGYHNSQSVVRFLDTKATAIVGIVPVVLGALAGISSWLIGEAAWIRMPSSIEWLQCIWKILASLILISLLLCLGTAISAVWQALHALLPRNTGSAPPSILFPYKPRNKRSSQQGTRHPFSQRLGIFVHGGSEQDELDDYGTQLDRMGEIVAEKLTAVQGAIRWLRHLLISAIIYIALLAALRFVAFYFIM